MIETIEELAVGFHPASAPDYIPAQHMKDLQLARLRAVVRRAYDHVALFRNRMEERGISPDGIKSLDDIAQLPFTVKTDLRDTYPFGLFASPMEEIVRLHASSGTTGKPIVVAYTQDDLDVWTDVMVRSFAACGLHAGDIIQNAYGYGLFTGGLGAHYGAEALGATVIPISGGNTDRQIMVMKDFGVTAICCTPSYFLHLIERADELGVDLRELPLRVGVFGAEPWTESMRRRIEADTGITGLRHLRPVRDHRPGRGHRVPATTHGLHIFEDHFYPEIIDPETGESLPDGAEGELVLTTLSKQAMPMIRYRTRDITALVPSACACGRTLRRIRRIGRRTDDMFIIRGVNVFPSPGRGGPAGGRRHAAALPDHPHAREGPRRDGSAGRGHPRGLQRQGRRAGRPAAKSSRKLWTAVSACASPYGWWSRTPSSAARARPSASSTAETWTSSHENPSDSRYSSRTSPASSSSRAALLARAGIDIRTLTLADTQQFGILRLIVSDWEAGAKVLREAGYVVNLTEVVAVEVPDRPGGLDELLELLRGQQHQHRVHVRVHFWTRQGRAHLPV